MADKLEIHWDSGGLARAIGESSEVLEAIKKETASRVAKANSLGAGYKTGRYYDRTSNELKGETTPKYDGDVKPSKQSQHWPIGIVHTANYASMKDNLLHNTLVKVK